MKFVTTNSADRLDAKSPRRAMPEISRDATPTLSASVVVVTLCRPAFLRTCLQHLAEQSVPVLETIVVDASPDDLSARLVADEFPYVRYLRNPLGPGTTGASRNLGLGVATGDILAFVDDDAFADVDWLEQLLLPYDDPKVGGVGGLARNGMDGEALYGVDDIGQFHDDGTLSGNFAADPGGVIEVDHFLGANMSFRRAAVIDAGGIRDGYPGTCLREETDLAFRVSAAGWLLVYNPKSAVQHVAAPYPKGRRFDARYEYFANRNHMVLLARHIGYTSQQMREYYRVVGRGIGKELRYSIDSLGSGGSVVKRGRGFLRGVSRASAAGSGTLVGLGAGYFRRRADGRC
jgi:GT2 family glycosyltransferase